MRNAFLKPAAITVAVGTDFETVPALVRDPETMQPLAVDGEWKAMSQFWTRRLRDGDVNESAPPASEPQPAVTGAPPAG